jgi:hypothetical protein
MTPAVREHHFRVRRENLKRLTFVAQSVHERMETYTGVHGEPPIVD